MGHGVIFDCDGVLVNTEALVIDLEIEAMAQLGVTYDRSAFIAKYMGASEPDFERGLNADHRAVAFRRGSSRASKRENTPIWNAMSKPWPALAPALKV